MIAISVILAALGVAAFGPAPALLATFAVAAVAPQLVRMDVAEHRLPNALVIPALLAGLAGFAVSWLATGTPPLVPLLATAGYAGFLFVLAWFGGMGMGDVKLAAALGLAAPTLTIAVLSPVLAFLLGGIASAIALVRQGGGGRIAFGPFLLGGYFGALVLTAVGRAT
ncbi:MAG: prepilin peptidase [Actinomycetota bacterium]|nr:prepilin peptidase [Actinomycetota bacterium]